MKSVIVNVNSKKKDHARSHNHDHRENDDALVLMHTYYDDGDADELLIIQDYRRRRPASAGHLSYPSSS